MNERRHDIVFLQFTVCLTTFNYPFLLHLVVAYLLHLLKLGELLGLRDRRSNLQHIESNGLGNWSTLSNNNNISLLDTESWRNVSSQVLVSLFVSVVFWNIVQVLSSDDNGSVHLGGHNGTGQDLSSDGNSSGEWTLLVDVVGLNGGLWGLESQSNILNPSLGSLGDLGLWVGEDVRLLELVCGRGGDQGAKLTFWNALSD